MSNDGPGVFGNLIGYVGDLFMAQLSASVVNTTTNWLSLCNTMNPSLANIFFGPANRVVDSTCCHVGLSNASNPDFGTSNPPTRAADVIHEAATLLLAWQGLSFFRNPGQLRWACRATAMQRLQEWTPRESCGTTIFWSRAQAHIGREDHRSLRRSCCLTGIAT